MRQVLLNARNGQLSLSEIPCATPQRGQVLIANRVSVISPGTEKMTRTLAQQSLVGKARARPDHVRRVLEKVLAEGLLTTARQVMTKLDEPMSMGYSSAGVVIACGLGVREFKPGDRVASNGPHAEVVCVPKNLCARIPENVADEQAAFTVLGAIAIQGVRLSRSALGETALVIGLGLIGQITVALLRTAGVRVIGTDLDQAKCELALNMGAEVARPRLTPRDVLAATGELGADVVLITASTKSDAPIQLAAEAVRQKGRVVAVGAVGMNLPRRPFYFKEAEFVVSCSYGPGRYDASYEESGHDYPVAHVRWTEQRNMQAVLDLMAANKLNLSPLISGRFPIGDAAAAYELIEHSQTPSLGILLEYPRQKVEPRSQRIELQSEPTSGRIGVGCVGTGNFARMVLLPAMRRVPSLRPELLCSASGLSAACCGKKLGFRAATSNDAEVFRDRNVDAVFVLTRHDRHAEQAIGAIHAGKHVFVEKPLCLTLDELQQIEEALQERLAAASILMVGFNRRFAPATRAVKQFFRADESPLTVSIRFNAGQVPSDHWTQDESIGGGRIIGEACHAIDLATYLTGSVPVRVFAESISGPHAPSITDDQCFVTLRHANGSVSNIAYLAGGDRAFEKERVEVVGGGKVALIEDFRRAYSWSGGRRRTLWRGRMDKGHHAELEAFASAITDGLAAPIPWEELRSTTIASMLAVRSLRDGMPINISQWAVETETQSRAA